MQPDHESLEFELPAFLAGELPPDHMLVVARAIESDPDLRRTLVEVAEMVAVLQDAACIPVAPDRLAMAPGTPSANPFGDVPGGLAGIVPGDLSRSVADDAPAWPFGDLAWPDSAPSAPADDAAGGQSFAPLPVTGDASPSGAGAYSAGPDPLAAALQDFGAPTDDELAVQRGAAREIRRARRHQWWTGAVSGVAAALVVVLGTVLGVGVVRGPSGASGPVPQVALAPIGVGVSASGAAHMDGHDDAQMMVVNVSGLGPAPAGHHYVVWLVKSDGTGAPLPVGTIGPTGGRFTLPATVAAGYDTIDVSIEPTGTGTGHSGDSVLRGKLA